MALTYDLCDRDWDRYFEALEQFMDAQEGQPRSLDAFLELEERFYRHWSRRRTGLRRLADSLRAWILARSGLVLF